MKEFKTMTGEEIMNTLITTDKFCSVRAITNRRSHLRWCSKNRKELAYALDVFADFKRRKGLGL